MSDDRMKDRLRSFLAALASRLSSLRQSISGRIQEKLGRKAAYGRLEAAYRTFLNQKPVTKLMILAPIIVVAALVFYVLFRSGSGEEEALLFEAQKGEFVAKITEIGELDAADSATISAQVDLPVTYLAPEGAKVRKGEVLVRFDAAKYEAALEESNAILQVARADLKKATTDLDAQRQRLLTETSNVEAEFRIAQLTLGELKKKPLPDELAKAEMELEKAKVAFENAQKKMEVLPDLLKKGYITRDTLEKAELEFVDSKAGLQLAQFNHKKVKEGATRQELEQAEIKLKQATAALGNAKKQMASQLQSFEAATEREKANVERAQKLVDKATVSLSRGILHAPRDGLVVYARAAEKEASKVQLGMIPFQGQPLIYLPDLSSIVVNTEISEFDIGRVKVGTPVEVKPEAYPGVVFRGTVSKIGTLARLKRAPGGGASASKAFDVAVKVEEADERLKPGLTATLDIITHREKDVLSVPLSAVVKQKDATIVYVSRNGRVEERKVTTGQSSEHSVIIREGLRPGEKVLLNIPAVKRP